MKLKTIFTPKPLLQRSPLLPGETLRSLLTRLSILNYYPSPTVLEEVLQFDWWDSMDAPASSHTFEYLEQLTEIPAIELFLASDYGLTPSIPPTKKSKKQLLSPIQEAMQWVPQSQEQDFHPAKASWYCPKCLDEEPYQRLSWRPATMAACLQHGCLLADRCPNCQQSVSVLELVLTRCKKCQADLRQAETISVAQDHWGWVSQSTLLGWRTNAFLADPGYGWPEQPSALLCSLAEGLAVGALFLADYLPSHPLKPPKSLKLHRLNDLRVHAQPSDVYWAYSRALEFISNWPEGFRTFLHMIAPEPESPLLPNLGLFYSYWVPKRWKHLDFKFIRTALEDFQYDRSWFAKMADGSHVDFAKTPHFARLREAVDFLNIPENVLIRLAQIGLVTEISSTNENLPTRFFRRSDLREIKQTWTHHLSLQETSYWLGFPPETVLRLVKEHVLKAVPGSRPNVRFTKTEVANLISRVDNRALVIDGLDDNLVSLADAAKQLACIQIDEVKLFQLTLSLKLPLWRSSAQQQSWACNDISFRRKDLDSLVRQNIDEKNWISVEDAAFELKVEDQVFSGWIERGLLKIVAVYNDQPYLKQKDLDQFRTEYIFFNQARDLLGITTRRMMGYIRRGKLVPVAGPDLDGCHTYLFPLRKVEKLAKHLQKLHEKRYSANQPD